MAKMDLADRSVEEDGWDMRLLKAIQDKGERGVCAKIDSCDYVKKNISNLSVADGITYEQFVCKQYPYACKLNLGDENE